MTLFYFSVKYFSSRRSPYAKLSSVILSVNQLLTPISAPPEISRAMGVVHIGPLNDDVIGVS